MATRREKYNIRERKDGRLEIRETIDGLRKSFYGKTEDEVIKKYEAYKAENHIYGTALTEKQHFDEYMKQWLYSVKEKTLKPSSFDRLEMTVLNWVNPTIGHIPVNKLTSIQIQDLLINKMYDDGLSASSIRKAFMAVNAACKYGLGTTFMTNPCDRVTLPSRFRFEKKEITFLSSEKETGLNGEEVPSEIERFKEESLRKMNSIDAYVHRYGVSFVFILNTGLRSGEMRALKWSDIDFENATVHIQREVMKSYDRSDIKKKEISTVEDTTKTRASNRYVPLNKTALWCLSELKKYFYTGNDDDFVILTKDGNIVRSRNYIRALKSICEKIHVKNITVHSLRHTFATQLFDKGKDVVIVSKILGHEDTKTTADTYIHVLQKQQKQAVLSLDEEI